MLFVEVVSQFANVYDHLHGFLHVGYGQEFVRSVEVQSTGKNVRAGQTFERELGSVGAAANGLNARRNACLLHSFDGYVDDVHHGVYLFAHVVVLVFDCGNGNLLTIFFTQCFGCMLEYALALLKALAVVVADDVGNCGTLHTAFYANYVIKSFVAFCALRHLFLRQRLYKLRCYADGIYHFILSIAWVYADACHLYFGTGSVEVFKFQFAQVASVHCVSPVATELFYVELVCAKSYFLVGVEAHADASMLYLRVLHEINHSLDYLGNTSLVIGSEESMAVGDDDVFAYVRFQFRELGWASDDVSLGIENNVAAIILLSPKAFAALKEYEGLK